MQFKNRKRSRRQKWICAIDFSRQNTYSYQVSCRKADANSKAWQLALSCTFIHHSDVAAFGAPHLRPSVRRWSQSEKLFLLIACLSFHPFHRHSIVLHSLVYRNTFLMFSTTHFVIWPSPHSARVCCLPPAVSFAPNSPRISRSPPPSAILSISSTIGSVWLCVGTSRCLTGVWPCVSHRTQGHDPH